MVNKLDLLRKKKRILGMTKQKKDLKYYKEQCEALEKLVEHLTVLITYLEVRLGINNGKHSV
jgi:hypothetical protein